MPSVTLTSLVGVGGGFIPSTISAVASVASGASGDIITITPPAGKRAALTVLSLDGVGVESGITISVNGSPVVSGATLGGDGTDVFSNGWIKIGYMPNANFNMVLGSTDHVITVTKDTGTTSAVIFYAYAYGD